MLYSQYLLLLGEEVYSNLLMRKECAENRALADFVYNWSESLQSLGTSY